MDKELQEKECSLCESVKPVSEFSKNSKYKDGYYKHCKSCHYIVYGRDAHFRRTYGISLLDYKDMLEQQNYRCITCGAVHRETKQERMVVDHCHSDGGVRGLICQKCNMALGSARDNPDILRNLADYLEKYYGN